MHKVSTAQKTIMKEALQILNKIEVLRIIKTNRKINLAMRPVTL